MSSAASEYPRVAIFGLVSKHRGKNRGGTSISIARLARYLAAEGVAVDILCHSSAVDQPALRQLPGGVRLWPLRSVSKLGLAAELYLYLRRGAPRSMLALDTRANQVACRVRSWPGVRARVFVSLRNTIAGKLDPGGGSRNRRLRRTFRYLYDRADGVVAISHGLAAEFVAVAGVEGAKLHVIYNLVVDAEFLAQLEIEPEHPWLDRGEPPVVVSVGRLALEKGFDTLLRAFAELRARRPARLIILGEGPEKAHLEQLAAGLGIAADVDLPGFVSHPAAYMRRAAVFALSSHSEAFGMVLAEALAAGCPVVSTDCPSGPREILDAGRYGDLVPVGDAAALANSISRALDAPPPEHLLREGGRRFSAEANGRRYMDLLLPGYASATKAEDA